mmetsp:Transcript_25753/g.102798  ORF Transcript_25753/g.102798 Transcript_25753/m.102798 type:complete len:261 (+) Transcript_25753:2527-3309(+)
MADAPVTQGAALEAFYGAATAEQYAEMMDAEMAKVVADLDLVASLLPADATILDTCVGSGHYLAHLATKTPATLEGSDISDAMLATARARLGAKARCFCRSVRSILGILHTIAPSTPEQAQATLRRADMLRPIDGNYGAILNNFALHHATRDDARRAVRGWARALAEGGVLYVSVWEGDGAIDFSGHDGDTTNPMAGMRAVLLPEADLVAWLTESENDDDGSPGLEIVRRRRVVEEEMGGMVALYVVAQRPRVMSTATTT